MSLRTHFMFYDHLSNERIWSAPVVLGSELSESIIYSWSEGRDDARGHTWGSHWASFSWRRYKSVACSLRCILSQRGLNRHDCVSGWNTGVCKELILCGFSGWVKIALRRYEPWRSDVMEKQTKIHNEAIGNTSMNGRYNLASIKELRA